jgi:hypothetical protein
MDDRLTKALEFSNYRQTLAIQRKTLKEKINAKLTYGYNGGLFKIDRDLLTFVQVLLSNGRSDNVVLLDSNDNPILIQNLESFKDEIFDRYFTSTYEYLEEYTKIKSSRTVEKLLDL